MSYLWRHLFPHPLMGRQLVHLFRAAGATNYSAGALLGMDHDQGFYKRWYRMTAEAIGPAAVGQELMIRQKNSWVDSGSGSLPSE